MQTPDNQQHTIGNEVTITFISIGNKSVSGKVDTGATTCSLHATNIAVNSGQQAVSFSCPELSSNNITVAIAGMQDVSSADGGEQARPIIKLDIEIDGVQMKDIAFNLNDRSNMDSMVLIGQNALQAGGFLIDVSKNETQTESVEDPVIDDQNDGLLDAIRLIMSSGMTISELIQLATNKE